jgi:hypothetical protein
VSVGPLPPGEPTARPGGAPPARRTGLRFEDIEAVVADLATLRRGCERAGNWSLAQACWHLRNAIEATIRPTTQPATPAQQAARARLDAVFAGGAMPSGIPAPESITPPAKCTEAEVDALVAALRRVAGFTGPAADHPMFGPLTPAEYLKLNLIHCAHHLSHLVPTVHPPRAPKPPRRRVLQFNSEDEVIGEVKRLRQNGCEPAGRWSLAQACWHLDRATQARMRPGPFPPNTPEQDARAAMFAEILRNGALPDGIQAPDEMTPPDACADDAIDGFLATVERFKAFPGPIAPHRLFGKLSDADARRLNLIHYAHHLSYQVPGDAARD